MLVLSQCQYCVWAMVLVFVMMFTVLSQLCACGYNVCVCNDVYHVAVAVCLGLWVLSGLWII